MELLPKKISIKLACYIYKIMLQIFKYGHIKFARRNTKKCIILGVQKCCGLYISYNRNNNLSILYRYLNCYYITILLYSIDI